VKSSTIEEDASDAALHELKCGKSGARALIWPVFGANCVQLELPGADGELVRVIDDAENLDALRDQPSRYGNPILFPWASRIAGGRYWFRGKQYQSKELHTDGDAWHGLVRARAWEVVASATTDTEASLTCEISTERDPGILASYPFPHRLRITFRLSTAGLSVVAEVKNTGGEDMPFGIGFHPYFKLPLGAGGARNRCLLEVHANKLWDWKALGAVRPGTSGANIGALQLDNHFSKRAELGSLEFNEGFTNLELIDGWVEARIIDPDAKLAVRLGARPDIKSLVVYTPPNRSVICLEPWTCTANMFNLEEAGVHDTGMIVLGTGQCWRGEMRISLEQVIG
jgi:aldose 1-epimerase